MSVIHKIKTPIIIGGLGGSGTRVVAECLIRSGVYLGQDLNDEQDNLLFTYFFKLPHRFLNSSIDNSKEVKARLAVHEQFLLGRHSNVIQSWISLTQATFDQAKFRRYKTPWIWERIKAAFCRRVGHQELWGWKEPHAIFFIKALKDFYPSGKFLLVIRNGLDMVYSKDNQQLRYWGSFVGLNGKDDSVQNKFEFWYRMNKHVVSSVKDVHIVKFEELCENPVAVLTRLFNFVGLDPQTVPQNVWNLPQRPASWNRYTQYSTQWISPDIKKKLAEFGYSL